MQIDRDHDRHPGRIKGAAINDRPDNRHDDVNDLKKIQNKAEDEQQNHHNQEDGDLIVEAAQILLDVMLTPIRDHHKVQHLRSDEDGEHHRGDF